MSEETTNHIAEMNENTSSKKPWPLIILFIMSFAVNGYLFYEYYHSNLSAKAKSIEKRFEALQLNFQDLENVKASLEEELENTRKHLEQTMSENLGFQQLNADLSRKVDEQTIRIRQLLNRGGNGDPAALLAAKAQIERLKNENASYMVHIDSLRQVSNLQSNKIEQALAKSRQMEEEAKAYKEKTDSIEQTLENSSLLLVQNLVIEPMRNKRGSDEVSFKAARVEKIKVSFTLNGGELVSNGEKEVVMRLIGVNNEVLTNDNEVLTDSEQLITDKKVVEFNGEPEKVKFNYKQNAEYRKGSYKVEILHKGVLINMGTFILD